MQFNSGMYFSRFMCFFSGYYTRTKTGKHNVGVLGDEN